MRISLHYRGRLNANGSPSHKHDIRLHFHRQLETLWSQFPLIEFNNWLTHKDSPIDNYSVLCTLGQCTFAPLVTERMNGIAELSVTLLRPEKPGGLLTQGRKAHKRSVMRRFFGMWRWLFRRMTPSAYAPYGANIIQADAVS